MNPVVPQDTASQSKRTDSHNRADPNQTTQTKYHLDDAPNPNRLGTDSAAGDRALGTMFLIKLNIKGIVQKHAGEIEERRPDDEPTETLQIRRLE